MGRGQVLAVGVHVVPGWVCAWCVSSRAAGAGYRALGTEGSVCGPGYPDIWCRVEPERVERGRGREKEREVY